MFLCRYFLPKQQSPEQFVVLLRVKTADLFCLSDYAFASVHRKGYEHWQS